MNLLTDDEIWKNDAIMAANSGYGANFETLRELTRAIEAAVLEKLTKVDVEPVNDWVLAYAKTIANCLWADHYKDDAPQWKVLPDLAGVLSQIDNMVSGLVPASALEALQAEIERLRGALERFSTYVHAEQSSTDGQVYYSPSTINHFAFMARAALAKQEIERDKS